MGNLQEPSTWQEYLGQLIEDAHERQRMAEAIRVRPITLQRWAEGVSRPRDENIRLLLKALPSGSYPLFMRLLIRDFPHLVEENIPPDRFSTEIPPEFYARSLHAAVFTPQPICRQTIQDLVLRQALEHLDPERHGFIISVVACVPPRQGRQVRSLREIGGLGTLPWPHDLPEKPLFLGSEALVGHAVNQASQCVVNSKDEVTAFPVRWMENERSAAAFPILCRTSIAGALLAVSTRECFFTQPRITVLERYSHLASLMFEPEEFFDVRKEIALETMPAYELQAPYFADYNWRISQKFAEANSQGAPITLREARRLVWQDLEDLLLEVFWKKEVTDLSEYIR